MQSEPPAEVIVCDDGSSECLKTFIKPYLKKIIYIRNEINKGVSAARNTGIRAAKSDYVAFLDSDDVWLPDKLAIQLSRMVSGGFILSHTDEFWLKDDHWLNQGRKHSRSGGSIFTKVLDMCRVSPSSLVMRRDAGFFDEDLRVCEDYEFILRMSLYNKIDYVRQKLLIKRAVTGDQLSSGIKHIESVRLGILERFAAAHPEIDGENKEALEKELSRKRAITGGRSVTFPHPSLRASEKAFYL